MTKSRFDTYEISPSLSLEKLYPTTINELKFMPNFDSKDAQLLMFQKFGKWDNAISIKRSHPLLVWTNLKMFNNSDELYTVGVSGERKEKMYYCSAFVLNSNDEDCLIENSMVKDSLISFFIQGTERIIKSDLEFESEMKSINKN